MQRYLLRFGYCGTHFYGSQKQVPRVAPHLWTRASVSEDRKTIQGALETLLIRLKPLNEPKVFLSSRTDSGVHAISTTAAVDLQRSPNGVYFFDPKVITIRINDYLLRSGVDIRIQKTLAVPGTFDPRNRATSRTYVYKFAVRKNPEEIPASLVDLIHIWKPGELKSNRKNVSKMQRAASILPLGDIGKITEVLDKFDFDKACEVTNMFLGENNFGSFASTTCWSPKIRLKDGFKTRVHFPLEFFNRNITECSLKSVPPPACMMSEPIYECFDFYTLTVTSRSFFRNQIRRMAAIILNVARGEKDISEVRYLLDNPSSDNCTGLPLAKPDGLYLAKLEYSPDDPDLMVATDSIDKLPVGPEPNPDIIRNPMIDWSHKNHILDVTEPLLGYRWFDPKVYLKKETQEKEKSADDEVDSN